MDGSLRKGISRSLRLCYVGWAHSIHTRRWLGWFARRGHTVSLITAEPGEVEGVSVYGLLRQDSTNVNARWFLISRWQHILSHVLRLRAILSALKPDLLHVHNLYFPGILGPFAGVRPLVVTPWNGDIVWSKPRSAIHRWAVSRSLKKADLITVDSHELLRACIRSVPDDGRIHIVQWGVELDLFTCTGRGPAAKARLGLHPDAPLVVSARNLGKMYNIDIIIRALAMARQRIPAIRLALVWHSGQDRLELERLCTHLDVEKAVSFVGHLSDRRQLADYYRAADVIVSVPNADTTSVSLLEAMACGATPVVSDLPSIREWIRDGWNGLVVSVRDVDATTTAIISAIQHPKLAATFRSRNTDLVRRRADHDREMARVESLYYALVKA